VKAPAALIALLATVVVARIAIVFVVGSPLATALAWAALLGALSVAALMGRQLAATVMAYLCLILGLDTLIQLFTARLSGVQLGAPLVWAALVLGTGAFILCSPQVKRFYGLVHGRTSGRN